MLIYLKDKGRCVSRILDNAVFALIVVDTSIEIILINAAGTGHPQSTNEIHDSGIMSRIKGPLNSRFVFDDILEIIHCFVEKTCSSSTQLLFSIE